MSSSASQTTREEQGELGGARQLQAALQAATLWPQGKRKKKKQVEGSEGALTVLFTFLASMVNSGELEFS